MALEERTGAREGENGEIEGDRLSARGEREKRRERDRQTER